MTAAESPRPGPQLNADTPITYIKGVGPKRAEALEEEGIRCLRDLLYHFPRHYLDRSTITPISGCHAGLETTIVAKVLSQQMVRTRRRSYYQILVGDQSGQMTCVWFNGIRYIQNAFHNGDVVAFSGKVEFFNGYQIVHPDYDKLESEEWDTLHTARIIPLYPSTASLKRVGLDSRGFRRLLKPLVGHIQSFLPEILPSSLRDTFQLLPLHEALRSIHFPDGTEVLQQAVRRLKFEELFFLQVVMAVRRNGIRSVPKSLRYRGTGNLLKEIYKKLPFDLTTAQKRVIKEIWEDMKSDHAMNRLLQGDVGSGKTIVALLSAAIAVSNGYQVAFMAPTEILAEQHYRSLHKFTDQLRIRIELLLGGQRKKQREEILQRTRSGDIDLLVGTHALIQEAVEFKQLAYAIIDEQHRFGVLQRGQLMAKGLNPDILVMTATPIPRTMSMTLYGDMDVSVIDELPKRKARIHTRLVNEDKLATVYQYIQKRVQAGDQAYIVYPLIEESQKMDLNAAIQGYEYLQKHVFPTLQLGLLHGSLKTAEKDAVMQAFSNGTIQILVSTTVVEVGVDNPNATVVVIENAERFGLTQLHQLRGRIGRGQKRSVCVLVERKRSETSHRRLQTILATTNGFEISEQDLKLRGPGEFYGTRQHGFPRMKIADLINDNKMMAVARREAFQLLKEDPHLRRQEALPIRHHLQKYYADYNDYINIL